MTKVDTFSIDTKLDLHQQAIRSGGIVLASIIIEKGGQIIILMVLARLLTPENYGLFGMVFALVAFLGIFADMGLPLAIVQEKEINHAQLSTIFWINFVVGLSLGAIIVAASPLIAYFYHEPVLKSVTLWYAISFPLVTLGAQHSALLHRRMAFGRMGICKIAEILVGGFVAIWMALHGAGVYALVGQQLSGAGTRVVASWLLSGWLPGLPVQNCGVQGMLKIGGYLTGFNIVNYFSRSLDKILLGYFWGAASVGLYSRAYTLILLPITFISLPINYVAIPTLARIQNDLPRMRRACLHIIKFIGFTTFPIMVLLMITASDVIVVVYGENWKEAVPIFQILCIVGIWQGIYNSTGQIFLATGRTDRMFKGGLAISFLCMCGFLLGTRSGARGIALAYALAFSIGILPYLTYAYATVGLKLSTALRLLMPAFIASWIMMFTLWIIRQLIINSFSLLARLVFSLITGVLFYILFFALIDRHYLLDIIHDIRKNLLKLRLRNSEERNQHGNSSRQNSIFK